MRLRYVVPLGIFVILAAFLAYGLTRDPREVPSPLIGKPVPAFELPTVHDGSARFSPQDLRGQVWLLNVWATWCVSCRQEHAVLMEAANEHGLRIVGLDYKDERPEAIDWLARRGDPYAVTAFDKPGRVGIDLGVYGVPETYVIDADGVIRHKVIGPVTRDKLTERIVPLVRELQGAAS